MGGSPILWSTPMDHQVGPTRCLRKKSRGWPYLWGWLWTYPMVIVIQNSDSSKIRVSADSLEFGEGGGWICYRLSHAVIKQRILKHIFFIRSSPHPIFPSLRCECFTTGNSCLQAIKPTRVLVAVTSRTVLDTVIAANPDPVSWSCDCIIYLDDYADLKEKNEITKELHNIQ